MANILVYIDLDNTIANIEAVVRKKAKEAFSYELPLHFYYPDEFATAAKHLGMGVQERQTVQSFFTENSTYATATPVPGAPLAVQEITSHARIAAYITRRDASSYAITSRWLMRHSFPVENDPGHRIPILHVPAEVTKAEAVIRHRVGEVGVNTFRDELYVLIDDDARETSAFASLGKPLVRCVKSTNELHEDLEFIGATVGRRGKWCVPSNGCFSFPALADLAVWIAAQREDKE